MKEKKGLAGTIVIVVGPQEHYWQLGRYFNVALAEAYGVEPSPRLPALNWLRRTLEKFEGIDLVIVDYDCLPQGGLDLMGLDDFCAEQGIPLLVVTQGNHNDPDAKPGSFGGPYNGESNDPPWRYVTTLGNIEEARDRFLEYWNS